MTVRFAAFEFDPDSYELRREGQPVPVEPQVLDVLALLVRHRDRLVPKEEILDEVWGDRFVSDSALTSRIKTLRHTLDDDGRAQRVIKTVHGRGYRFVADVEDGDGARETLPEPRPHNLPTERTPLFGRDGDIANGVALLDDHRLVSLLGLGGSGKTRLATAIARALLTRFPDGVWFVDLVPTSDDASVETAIAHTAGLAVTDRTRRDQLSELLDARDVLLVLDNCEHVRPAVTEIVDHLLEHTERPRFLATSREPLGLPDERRVAVEPLGSGSGPGSPAIALFLARTASFGVEPDTLDTDAIAQLCARLDGLPLAIELAAAQLRHLSLADLMERLDRRFEILTTTGRPGLERQASLLTVLDDTWAMLDAEERAVLAQLAVLPGRFTLADAEELAAELSPTIPATLARLVDRSLVVSEPAERRYRVLDTVRLFAAEESDAGSDRERFDRHATWCLDRVGDELTDHLYDFEAAMWCIDHYDDLRVGEQHLRAGARLEDAVTLLSAGALAMHIDDGTRAADMLVRIEGYLDRLDDPALVARLHIVGVLCGMATRSPARIASHGEAAVAAARRADEASVLAASLVYRSWSAVFADAGDAIALVDEAASIARGVGDDATYHLAGSYRAFHLAVLRRYDEANEQARSVAESSVGAGTRRYPGYAALVAWTACTYLQDPAAAVERISVLTDYPTARHAMWANQLLAATTSAANGEVARTARLLQGVRERLERAGRSGLPDLLVPISVLAARLDDPARARRWLRAVRDAGQPTQSFQVTVAYNRAREAMGLADDPPLASATLEEVGEEAFGWLAAQQR